VNLLLAIGGAALLVLVAPRFHLAWLAPVALAPLLVAAAREPRAARRFLSGWAAGAVYWCGVCYWIQFVLAFHGGMGNLAGCAVFALFCAAKGLQMAVFATLAGPLMRRAWAVPAAAALWVGVEATHGPLGFAWLALGNAGIDMSLPMRLAPWTGVYGLSFVFAATSAALAAVVLGRPRRELAWIAVLPLLILLPPLPEAQPARETAVVVQPNIAETAAWTPEEAARTERRVAALTLRAALDGAAPAIVVWPEVPAPFYWDEDARFRAWAAEVAATARAPLLLGVVGRAPSGAPLNSAVLVEPSGRAASRYDKVNLVPFGEFVPWPLGIAKKISTETGDFEAGRAVVVSTLGDRKLGTFICYESVVPHYVRRFVAGGAEVLFNLSNDGYFGRSAAREQHLEIARMRAAENRRWILRATNDGLTAAIDPAGEVRGTLPPYQAGAARMGFAFLSEQTFYTRRGDWFAVACGALAAALAALSRGGSGARRRP
jgi:apolipoprotein N-acyltransferase